jgi:hypothetical protein
MKDYIHFTDINGDSHGSHACIPITVPENEMHRHVNRTSAEFAPLLDELRNLAATSLLGPQVAPINQALAFVLKAVRELATLSAMQEHLAAAEARLSIFSRQQIEPRSLEEFVGTFAKLREVRDANDFATKLAANVRAEIAQALVESRAHVAEHAGVTAAAERFGSKLRKLVAKEETAAAQ